MDGVDDERISNWTADAMTVVDRGSCALTPPLVGLELPLRTGQQWHSTSTCESRGGTVRWDEDAKVVGSATTEVHGRRTATWIIERATTTTASTGSATAVSEQHTSELFAPALGLVVYETGKVARPDRSGQIVSSSWTRELV